MLQTVRVSVAKTWRFVDAAGRAATTTNERSHREELGKLMGVSPSSQFALPWAPYESTLWGNFFNAPYRSVDFRVLVSALLPLLYEKEISFPAPECRPSTARFEAFRHPFAVTTVVHVNLFGLEPWPSKDRSASVIADFLKRSLLPPEGQLRDGIPLTELPTLPEADFQKQRAWFEPVSEFVLLSGLHQEAQDPKGLAYRLASLFEASAPDQGHPMKADHTGIAVTGGKVGFVLPRGDNAMGAKLRCLHENVATLLAYMQNLSTIVPMKPTASADWFRRRAALILNHLYRRAALRPEKFPPEGIYKSRVAELWMNHLGLNGIINAITADEAVPPPALPT